MKIIVEEDFDLLQVDIVNKFLEDASQAGISIMMFICPENDVKRPVKLQTRKDQLTDTELNFYDQSHSTEEE